MMEALFQNQFQNSDVYDGEPILKTYSFQTYDTLERSTVTHRCEEMRSSRPTRSRRHDHDARHTSGGELVAVTMASS